MADRRHCGRRRHQFVLAPQVLERLMPLHAVLSATGRIRGAGPTLQRVFGGQRIVGRSILSLFEVRGPARIAGMADFAASAGRKLHLIQRGEEAPLRLRGVAMPLGRPGDGYLLNLSFGFDCPRAVTQLRLTDADFATTDMTMELLYLAEANTAIMTEIRAMSVRLDDARLQAEEEAMTDPLTGLRNRRASDSLLARLCREAPGFGLMQLDLDYFKQVNDRFGHAAGDHVLKAVATVLRRRCRAMDSLARVGGDEFLLVLPGLTDEARIARLARLIIADLQQPIGFGNVTCRIAGSIGYIIVAQGEEADPVTVLARADQALYAAKQDGRCRVRAGSVVTWQPDRLPAARAAPPPPGA